MGARAHVSINSIAECDRQRERERGREGEREGERARARARERTLAGGASPLPHWRAKYHQHRPLGLTRETIVPVSVPAVQLVGSLVGYVQLDAA